MSDDSHVCKHYSEISNICAGGYNHLLPNKNSQYLTPGYTMSQNNSCKRTKDDYVKGISSKPALASNLNAPYSLFSNRKYPSLFVPFPSLKTSVFHT